MLRVVVTRHAIERGRDRVGPDLDETELRQALRDAVAGGRVRCRRPRWLPTRKRATRRVQGDPRFAWPEDRRFVLVFYRRRVGHVLVTVLTREEPDEWWDDPGDPLEG